MNTKSDHIVKEKVKYDKYLPTECLLNNIIDKKFQAMLLPLSLIPSFFLMSRFSVINNFITPDNHVPFYIKPVIGSIILVLCHIFRYIHYSNLPVPSGSGVIMFLLGYDLAVFSSASIIIHIVSSSQRSNVVELIIKLHQVLNVIQIDRKQFIFKHTIQNWISVLSVFSINVLNWFSSGKDIGFSNLLVGFIISAPVMIFDVHIVNVTRTIVIIKNELRAWNDVMVEVKNKSMNNEEQILDFSVSEKDMFNAYVSIVKAFCLCKKVYQFSYTYFGFQTFAHILINVEYFLEVGKSSADAHDDPIHYPQILMIFSIAVWNAKNLVLLVTLSVGCESFYRAVKNAESCCAQILSDDRSGDTRMICKNVLRLNRAALHKLSAFGVFDVDAAFPLRLVGALVAYTVVLLQFAFLSS